MGINDEQGKAGKGSRRKGQNTWKRIKNRREMTVTEL